MIVPTIGRVALFIPFSDSYVVGRSLRKGMQHAATVCHVHSDRMVNLSVFDCNGKQFGKTSVTLRQPEDPIPQCDYCEWMEYQVKTAK